MTSVQTPNRIAGLIAAQAHAQRQRLHMAAAAGAVVSIAAVCLLGLSGWFITGAALAGVAGMAAVQAFNYMMPSAIIRLLAILRTGARYIERVAGHEAALKALARLRPQLFDALAAAPPEQALSLSSGETSARLVQDVDAIQTLFVRKSSPWALGAGAVSSAALAGMASPLAGALLLGFMAASCLGVALIARRLSDPAGKEAQIAMGALKDRLTSLEAVAPELKAYSLSDWAVQRAAETADRHDRTQIALTTVGGWMNVWQMVMTGAALAAVVFATTGADLPLTALAALATLMGMESAAGLVTALHQNGAAREAADRLDAAAPQVLHHHDGVRPPLPSLTIITADANLRPPQRLGLVGPSGSGKTTFIERLIGLRAAIPGEIIMGGLDAASIDPISRRVRFAYAAQDVRLLNGTVRENLLLAGPAKDEHLWQALEDAALAERIRAEPQGLDAPVGPNGDRLSGGERRRLGLARAYLRTAAWLVLDEPTEGLDAATEAKVLAALERRLSETGQGLILVSHRTAPIRICQTCLRVEGMTQDGRVMLTPERKRVPA